MALKELRIRRHLSQEQLAQMAGLNVRTIQRVESGHNASFESLKCLASVLEVDVSTLKQEKIMVDIKSDHWQNLPFWLKFWFATNFLTSRPTRNQAKRVEVMSHVSGFLLCLLGIFFDKAQFGGLIMLSSAYFTYLLIRQGDMYGVWYDPSQKTHT